MTMKTKSMPAGEFKAKCLAVLDGVARTGEPVVVTKRGRPVARVVPLDTERPRAGLDPFERAIAAAGAVRDPGRRRNVAEDHDRALAEIWGRGR